MGSISTTLIDHKFGLFPPVNIRPLYIILGVLLMISSLLWMYSVRSDPAGASSPSAPLFRSSTPSPF
jgi:hypothetical protein